MTDQTLAYVLGYYSFFWLLNVAAYAKVSLGLYGWEKFIDDGELEKVIQRRRRLTMIFGLTRLAIGLMGFLLYEISESSILSTILILGTSSLLLNTLFIMIDGNRLTKELKRIKTMPEENQHLLKQAIKAFSSLDRTTHAA